MEAKSEKKSSWGGFRNNSGRKKAEGVRHTYTIPEDVAQWIKDHGDGAYITVVMREIMSNGNCAGDTLI